MSWSRKAHALGCMMMMRMQIPQTKNKKEKDEKRTCVWSSTKQWCMLIGAYVREMKWKWRSPHSFLLFLFIKQFCPVCYEPDVSFKTFSFQENQVSSSSAYILLRSWFSLFPHDHFDFLDMHMYNTRDHTNDEFSEIWFTSKMQRLNIFLYIYIRTTRQHNSCGEDVFIENISTQKSHHHHAQKEFCCVPQHFTFLRSLTSASASTSNHSLQVENLSSKNLVKFSEKICTHNIT